LGRKRITTRLRAALSWAAPLPGRPPPSGPRRRRGELCFKTELRPRVKKKEYYCFDLVALLTCSVV
jgi:hypothetical protein